MLTDPAMCGFYLSNAYKECNNAQALLRKYSSTQDYLMFCLITPILIRKPINHRRGTM